MTSNITLVDSSGNRVTIGTSKPEEMITNDISELPIPKTRSTESAGMITKIVNIMKLQRHFKLQGEIADGGDSSDGNFTGTDTAQQQRTKLRNMIMSTRNVLMTYDDIVNLSVAIRSVSIKETTDLITPDSYDIQIALVAGTNVFG